MAQNVHYEVFARSTAKVGWKLVDAKPDRDGALKYAHALMAEGAAAVRVVKETYNDETGDFLTLKIFEDGLVKVKSAPAQEDVPYALPCFRPDDLYSYHARLTLARLIPEFLARNKITVIELLHRADVLEKLEATGTLVQHAIQKIAVAQASSTSTPVQQIVKSLNELTTKAFHRVYRDHRAGAFPNVAISKFGELASKLATQSDGLYVLNGAIARVLQGAKGWDEKLVRLLALMDEAPTEGPGGPLLICAIDAIIAETLSGSAALHELIGAKDNLGASLMSLVELFLGRDPSVFDGERQGLLALTQRFAADDLPEARTAIAGRIIAEFKSHKRLCPESLVDEFKTLRAIANRVVMGVGKYLSHEDLIAAFTLRSQRLIIHETLGEYLADAESSDEKLERLLFVEENIIGAENKRQLASFIIPIITATSFENHFHAAKLPVIARLQRLAQLTIRVGRSGFQDIQRNEITERLDRIACDVEARCKLLDSIAARHTSHVERANTILKLFSAGTFTEGKLSAKARLLIIDNLSKPGFLTGYVALASQGGENNKSADAVMAELMQSLEKIGITEETGLKSIAA